MFNNLSDTQRIIISFCAIAIVFMIIGAVLFSLFMRSFRHFWIVGLVNKLVGTTKDIADDSESVIAPHPPVDLEAKVEALDFEASVAKYAMQAAVPPEFADSDEKHPTPKPTEGAENQGIS